MSKEYKDYKGAIHIHSRYSDGSGNLKEIVASANRAGLDYLIITDHHTLRHKREGAEEWHQGTLVLVGQEISPKANHYLALGIEQTIKPEGMDVQEYIDEVNKQGGLGFIVHPDSSKKRSLPLKERPWSAWGAKNFTGLELWSYMYDWLTPVNLFNLFYYILRPARAIKGPSHSALQRWDRLLQERPVVAIGGVDAHARNIIPLGILKVFPYFKLFSTIRTHVLVPPFKLDLDHDRALVYSALRRGHSYLSYDYLAEASGLRFEVKGKDEEVIMGDEVRFSSGLTLTAASPRSAHLRLIRNGRVIRERKDSGLEMLLTEPGIYRLEVRLEEKPWIFTNPIYVR
jgi:hypothetical protein